MTDYQHLVDTAGDIFAGQGDRAFVNKRARDLRVLLDAVIRDTNPGAGEFKWSAKTVKALSISPPSRTSPATLLVATDCATTWHGNGCYMVKGEPSKQFDNVAVRTLDYRVVMDAISDRYTLPEVTIGDPVNGTTIALSDGTHVNRTFLAYVASIAGPCARYYHGDALAPVVVTDGLDTIAVIMPIRK